MSEISRLTDDQIRHIFGEVMIERHNEFIGSFAKAVCQSSRLDFHILRPISLIMIGKYKLGTHLANFDELRRRPLESAS